ncbi:MAG: dihydropteroate synthase [Chthoniobacter sp.]|nr:dihydropteroate synthase [Chthoniobacter sp.]
MRLTARGVTLEWPRPPLIMGIVNLSADSFSGDGLADVDAALEKARALLADGADIIDVGAESARTNRQPITEDEEAAQLTRFITRWNADFRHSSSVTRPSPLLSINTWRPAVARAALAAGGHILNDIGALPTDENARICAETGAALLIMHSVGVPKVAHTHIGYDDIMARLDVFFAEKIALAERAGVPRDSLILDPGIDFAKQRADNLRIYRELDRLARFDRPILLPVSRKTVIGEVLDLPTPADRDAGTVACIVQGMLRSAAIFRVHNVRAAAQAVRIISAVENP